jgi:RNA polymerase sigma factor (sigma-70 family)
MVEAVAKRVLEGDRDALDALVRELQGDVYGLALRMLWNREDAEDATQEILVRTVTRLSQFDFRSKLKTWVYRIAVNYILDMKKSPVERMQLNFYRFAEDLAAGLSSEGPTDAERSLLIEEVKVGCTLGMLQCLDAFNFATKASSYAEIRDRVRHVESARRALEVHRTSHPPTSSVDFARRLVQALDL